MSCNDDVYEDTVNGDACLSNNGPGSVPPRNPSRGPPQQPNFPTSQTQVTLSFHTLFSLVLLLINKTVAYCMHIVFTFHGYMP